MKQPVWRQKIISALTFGAILLFAAGLVAQGEETSAAATEALQICANVLIPSLFPFFVVSQMAVLTGLAATAGRAFSRPMRWLFGLPGACAPAFILGLIGGYPVGARTAISLHQQGLCTKAEAERLLSFCNNSGPAFILGAVGTMVFGTTAAGVLLYTAHVLASILVGIIFRRYKAEAFPQAEAPPRAKAAPARGAGAAMPLGRAFTTAVSDSFASILNICAFVIFFSVAIRLLVVSGVLPAAAAMLAGLMSPLGLSIELAQRLLSGLLEVTSGVYGLLSVTAGMGVRLSAAAFMLGWAGVSVHCQVLNFIGQSGLSTLPYILGKLLHGILSAALAFAFAWLLPFDAQVGKTLSGQLDALQGLTAQQAFGLALASVLAVWGLFVAASALAPPPRRR